MMLKNPRHEKFAQFVATGVSASEAYRRVYGKRGERNADTLAPRLSGKVRERVIELQKRSETDTVLSLSEKREFLAQVVRSSVGTLSRESKLLQAIKVSSRKGKDKEPDEEVIEYRLPDKRACIELDAKLAGEFTEHHQIVATIRVAPDVVLDKVRKLSPVIGGLVNPGAKN